MMEPTNPFQVLFEHYSHGVGQHHPPILLSLASTHGDFPSLEVEIRLLPVPKSSASFHDFEQYERLVETASALDRQTELIGEARNA